MSDALPIPPTRRPNAFTGFFTNGVSAPISCKASPFKLAAFGSPVLSGSQAAWLTRVEGVESATHLAAQGLRLSRRPALRAWEDGEGAEGLEPASQPLFNSHLTWEHYARCLGGDLEAARGLMSAIEIELGANPHWSARMLGARDDTCFEAYLIEMPLHNMGMVHFVHENAWGARCAESDFELALRGARPDIFERLPWTFNSEEYFVSWDFYCSDNFFNQTSSELGLAVFDTALSPRKLLSDLLALSFELNGDDSCARPLLEALARRERDAIASATGPALRISKSPRV